VGPQAPPTAGAARARAGARLGPWGPPTDYRDNPLPTKQVVPDCTPIPVPPSTPIDTWPNLGLFQPPLWWQNEGMAEPTTSKLRNLLLPALLILPSRCLPPGVQALITGVGINHERKGANG
jgi:hypothetical protein